MNPLIKIYLLLIGLLFMSINAQTPLKDGDNIKNKHFDKFVGTWVWSSANDSFTLILKKDNVKFVPTMDLYGDVLYGFHKYVKNGKEIENTTQYKNTNYYDKKSSLLGGMDAKNISNKIEISVTPPVSNQRLLIMNIEYIDDKRIKINNIIEREHVYLRTNGDPPFDYSRKLPENIILTKQ